MNDAQRGARLQRLAAEQVLDDRHPPLGGQAGSVSAMRSSSDDSNVAREPEQLVLDLGEPALGAGDFEQRVRVRLDAGTRRHGQLLPTWLM